MTRLWAPAIKAIQDKLRDVIKAERDANIASLPSELQGDNFQIITGVGDAKDLLVPCSIRVLPAENSALESEPTGAFEGPCTFPCDVQVRSGDSARLLSLLNEAAGLVIDAVLADPTLVGLCGGPGSPAIQKGPITADSADRVANQEVLVRLIVRVG